MRPLSVILVAAVLLSAPNSRGQDPRKGDGVTELAELDRWIAANEKELTTLAQIDSGAPAPPQRKRIRFSRNKANSAGTKRIWPEQSGFARNKMEKCRIFRHDSQTICWSMRGQSDSKPSTSKIASLIEQLGHDDFDLREHASEALVSLGEDALDALRKAAASSKDPEIQRRADAILRAAGLPDPKLAKTLVPQPADFEFLRTIKGKSRKATLAQFGHPHEAEWHADGTEQWTYTRADGNLFWVFFRSGIAILGTPTDGFGGPRFKF